MKGNDISFAPFHDNQTHDNLFDFIIGNEVSKGGTFSKNKATGDILIKNANELIKVGKFNSETEESRFLKVFDYLLEIQVKNILNIK